ncbi:nuclear transport factor 2 family protein [Levilactobacillus brevis]|uniref:nuclear transport factor 2 family protein n=1 Tax=Levilactobacillus brevis TaxID=1580 RepID=UPI002074138B|nr:nuclear transport factor 2 family protein [Levilactobacillus brevis]
MTEELIQLYRDYNAAMAANDTSVLAQLLAPEFTLAHMTGYVQPRAEWFQELEAGTMHYYSSVEDHVSVHEMVTGWQIVGQSRVVARIHGGSKSEWPLNTDLRVQRVADHWQIISAVVTTY